MPEKFSDGTLLDPASPDSTLRAKSVKLLKKTVDLSSKLNAASVILHPGGVCRSPAHVDEKPLLDSMRALRAYAPGDIGILLENMPDIYWYRGELYASCIFKGRDEIIADSNRKYISNKRNILVILTFFRIFRSRFMILVVGCGPMGSAIFKALSKDNDVAQACDKEYSSPASGCIAYDIRNAADVAQVVNHASPQKIILSEEIANVEYCERNRLDAMELNTRGVRYFVEASMPFRSRAIYLSSAYVFDGRKSGGLYTEYDHVNPINVYGETKLMGEVAVDKAADHLTIRMGEVYGDHPDNFAKRVLDSLKYGQKLELSRDMYFSPIYIEDAANAVRLLVAENVSGLYNLAGPERISHYEMGARIACVFGLKEDLVVPLSMEEMGFTVRMPGDLSLDISKVCTLAKVRGVDEGLEAMKSAMVSLKK